MTEKINYKWCDSNDVSLLDTLAGLFLKNINESYISHGEVIDGRANNLNEWKADIREIMKEEFSEAINNSFNLPGTFTKLAMAVQNEAIVALALIEFHPSTKVIVLCDIVVDKLLRGQKIGESMFNWIEAEAGSWGAKQIFLESGISNQKAHHFFERVGFHCSSVVMVKDINK
jgi:N-acetylglutamate synthase-like GNAT family acetyltransferase